MVKRAPLVTIPLVLATLSTATLTAQDAPATPAQAPQPQVPAAPLPAGVQDVEEEGDARASDLATDNACVVQRRGRFGLPPIKIPIITDAVTELIRSFGIGDGPICRAETWEELLILTGFMIDSAALSAARGVDAAQAALGLTRTLQAEIEQRERGTEGFAARDLQETEVFVQKISEESRKARVLLEERRQELAADPAIQAHLASAQKSLNEVAYYSTSAGTGATLFGRFMKSAEAKTFLTMLDSQHVGIGSEFARSLPERGKNIANTIDDTLTLRGAVGDVLDRDEKLEDGTKRAREASQKKVKPTREGLKPYKLTRRQA